MSVESRSPVLTEAVQAVLVFDRMLRSSQVATVRLDVATWLAPGEFDFQFSVVCDPDEPAAPGHGWWSICTTAGSIRHDAVESLNDLATALMLVREFAAAQGFERMTSDVGDEVWMRTTDGLPAVGIANGRDVR